MNMEEICFQLILHGGDAKSCAMEAIQFAKQGQFELAEEALENCETALVKAHKQQSSLLYEEANGHKYEIRVLLIHAQDHLMNAITVKDLAKEIIAIHKQLQAAR